MWLWHWCDCDTVTLMWLWHYDTDVTVTLILTDVTDSVTVTLMWLWLMLLWHWLWLWCVSDALTVALLMTLTVTLTLWLWPWLVFFVLPELRVPACRSTTGMPLSRHQESGNNVGIMSADRWDNSKKNREIFFLKPIHCLRQAQGIYTHYSLQSLAYFLIQSDSHSFCILCNYNPFILLDIY